MQFEMLQATDAWDPGKRIAAMSSNMITIDTSTTQVTGLGTPIFPELLRLVM
jgi:hypothetical protein